MTRITATRDIHRDINYHKHPLSCWDTQKIFSDNPKDELYIDSIATVASVEFRLKTGWTPRISNRDEDIVVELPTGVVVLGLLVSVISVAIENGTSNLKEIAEILTMICATGNLNLRMKNFYLKFKNSKRNLVRMKKN